MAFTLCRHLRNSPDSIVSPRLRVSCTRTSDSYEAPVRVTRTRHSYVCYPLKGAVTSPRDSYEWLGWNHENRMCDTKSDVKSYVWHVIRVSRTGHSYESLVRVSRTSHSYESLVRVSRTSHSYESLVRVSRTSHSYESLVRITQS